ncbi:MAG TPA: GGDEF domain-containing protein [Pyrinomonadaceae bacterium]|nr:GGDEF domain-containing protein [Pyrinomonadaceae bacterium]
MDKITETPAASNNGRTASTFPVIIIAASLAAIVATYFLANSAIGVEPKTRGFSAIIGFFLAVCALFYFWQKRAKHGAAVSDEGFAVDLDRRLEALDEANEFFTGALGPADTFRLVANRIKGVVEYRSLALLLLDASRSHFVISEVEGIGVSDQKGKVSSLDAGISGRCYYTQIVELGREEFSRGDVALPSIAIPLIREAEVFGILRLNFEPKFDLEKVDPSVFESIGSRVASLILSSVALAQSQQNALTDATTDLPNERAFYLIVENQIAEASRNREARPLTILAMDIKGFDEINQKFGHAAGDRALNFVAHTIKDNLRQMDFFARSQNDEFLAVLPTASKEMSSEVIARIHTGFFGRKLKLSETDSIEVEMNFGWAAYGEDGETVDTLLNIARIRKDQAKYSDPSKVLWFPKELVN